MKLVVSVVLAWYITHSARLSSTVGALGPWYCTRLKASKNTVLSQLGVKTAEMTGFVLFTVAYTTEWNGFSGSIAEVITHL